MEKFEYVFDPDTGKTVQIPNANIDKAEGRLRWIIAKSRSANQFIKSVLRKKPKLTSEQINQLKAITNEIVSGDQAGQLKVHRKSSQFMSGLEPEGNKEFAQTSLERNKGFVAQSAQRNKDFFSKRK